jgi:hypothetical protein
VKPPRVAGAPAALECRLWRTLELPGGDNTVVFGEVVAVYIDDAYVHDGRVDTGAMRIVSRLGYMDYGVLEPADVFTLNRPLASDDGQPSWPHRPNGTACTADTGRMGGTVAADEGARMGWFSKKDDGFFLSTVMPTPEMARIEQVLGVVHGEAVIGANIFRDLFSSVRDVVGGRAGGYERALAGARDAALEDLIEAAKERGATA